MNRVYVRIGNEPVPTRQRSVGARLLSPLRRSALCTQAHSKSSVKNKKDSTLSPRGL